MGINVVFVTVDGIDDPTDSLDDMFVIERQSKHRSDMRPPPNSAEHPKSSRKMRRLS